MNSKRGRNFVSKLRNIKIFVDLKLNDTVNTMVSAVKALKRFEDKLPHSSYIFRFNCS